MNVAANSLYTGILQVMVLGGHWLLMHLTGNIYIKALLRNAGKLDLNCNLHSESFHGTQIQ
jgi:hypothetical protein